MTFNQTKKIMRLGSKIFFKNIRKISRWPERERTTGTGIIFCQLGNAIWGEISENSSQFPEPGKFWEMKAIYRFSLDLFLEKWRQGLSPKIYIFLSLYPSIKVLENVMFRCSIKIKKSNFGAKKLLFLSVIFVRKKTFFWV